MTTRKLPPGVETAEADSLFVFDFARQAWFPDDGQPLDANRTAQARLKRAVNWEPAIGLRSSDAELETVKTFAP